MKRMMKRKCAEYVATRPRDHRLGLLQNDLNTVHATCTPEHPAPALSSPVLGRSLLLSAPVRHNPFS